MDQALAHPDASSFIGVADVRPDGDGFYVPDPDGPILAGIVAVIPDDMIIDLVAIDLLRPKLYRRRIGLADLLGESNVVGLSFTGEPLLIHPGPADWVNAGGRGVAVLEWTQSVRGLLSSLEGGLKVTSLEFAEELERKLTEAVCRPRIFVQRGSNDGR